MLIVFRPKRRDSSDESDKPARYQIDTEDDISERSENRDSNYVGTDLYWENRFYQVRPFKQPNSEETDQEDYVVKQPHQKSI